MIDRAAILAAVADARARLDQIEQMIAEETPADPRAPTTPDGAWIKASDAARLCGVHPQTMRRWAIDGDIVGDRIANGTWRILRASLAPMLPKR